MWVILLHLSKRRTYQDFRRWFLIESSSSIQLFSISFPNNLWSGLVQKEYGDPRVHLLSSTMFVVQLHYCIICSREWYIHVFINDTSSLSNCCVAAVLYFSDSLLTEVFTDYRVFKQTYLHVMQAIFIRVGNSQRNARDDTGGTCKIWIPVNKIKEKT